MKRLLPILKLSVATAVFAFLCVTNELKAGCIYLQTLEAVSNDNGNVLTWSTLAETDNGFFLVERSNNGIDFEKAARVKGGGTTADKQEYIYTDLDNKGLRVFYRLVQVDLDGGASFSNTVLIHRKGGETVFEIISLEGSVTDKYFNLNIESKKAGNLEYRLQTRMGEVLLKGLMEVVKGENAVSIDLSEAIVGTYQFSIRIENEIEVLALKKVDEPVVPESILTIRNDEK